MSRRPGLSVRLKLALSYAALVVVAGALLLGAVWVFLLRYVPDQALLRRPDTKLELFPVRSELLEVFAPRAAVVLLFLLVLGLAGGWWLAGRVLAPLTHITEATRTVATGALDHRISLTGRRDEFRELADAFDAMLARLEANFAEQQRFAANASHELRTPLAITKTLLDVAGRDGRGDPEATFERLRCVNARAIELTEALLLLSRADRRGSKPEAVDLSLLAEEAFETILPLADSRGVVVDLTGTPAWTEGSDALLLQLTTNLVHNAIVHNAAHDGRVTVTTSIKQGWAVLTVENTGPHLAPELVATLDEPFRRGVDRVRNDHGGVGLGLAIAKRIVQAHDGRMELAARRGGGLVATVRLPARRAAAAGLEGLQGTHGGVIVQP